MAGQAAPPRDGSGTPVPGPSVPGLGATVVALAEALEQGDVLFAATDEPRAAAIARALAVASPAAEVVLCPSSDALPGDSAPASAANAGQRVAALRRLRLLGDRPGRPRIACITTGEATARLYPAPAALDSAPPIVHRGEAIALDAFAAALLAIGYVGDDRVDEPGEVALRGQVVDVFPADANLPYRIEAQDGAIAHIRSYDPASQRTIGEVEVLQLGHAAEPDAAGGVLLLDHLPAAAIGEEPGAATRRARLIALAADAGRRHPARPVRDMAEADRWEEAAQARATIDPAGDAAQAAPRFVEGKAPMRAFARTARAALDAGERLVLLGSARDLRFLARRAAKALGRAIDEAADWRSATAAPPGSATMLAMPVDRGFRRGGVLAIAAADLLGSRAERDPGAQGPGDAQLFDLGDIRVGDVVVHEDHGVAVVGGLAPLPAADGAAAGDAIVLTFAGAARRLVPAGEADRIWRYGADADAVALDRLDGTSWQARRGAIDAAIAESARALTAIAAERGRRAAPVLAPDPAAYERFSSGFPFTETADQARAIAAVRADLAGGRPMDRLVIGDVGYGKTEVALRAAALAALAGHQVAIAAPTTVLARQHLESFRARFEASGLVVAGLSRLSSEAEKRAAKAGIADGSVSIVVGTGAVAGKGVVYRNLGLVVIDEEQRFGAADKARLAGLGAGHVLALSATPIPRTLQSALVGLQQLSVIATPPARRQPIRTAIGALDPDVLRTALLRERGRGGQSFVVVPRIEDMAPFAERLARLVPELAVLRAHGKMPAAEIDEAMVRFGRGEGDVLLATNIIEAGLDVPRANTMAIWRADRFGLSQLHQLRGRVGRGSRRGQVLLLTDPEGKVAERTLKRLRTLQAFDRLGAGFAISARDLDMRGAGDLLGEAQAGHMKLIGIDLYQHLLEAALRAARGETVERWAPELNLGLDGRLPESWVPEEEVRVTLYARLARLEDAGAVEAFEAELEDRFGTLPEEARRVMAIARVAAACRAAGIARIDAGPGAIALTPRRDFAGDAAAAGLTSKNGRLLLAERIEDAAERLVRIETLLEALVP